MLAGIADPRFENTCKGKTDHGACLMSHKALTKTLKDNALKMTEKSFSPYSNFQVGASLCSGSNRIFNGCNVENLAFPVGTCAEEAAIAAMISAGEHKIKEIVIVASKDGEEVPCSPCGACRQRIAQFSDKDTLIHFVDASGTMITQTISELLPHSFSFE
jgi:cytidine deaminase